jgi:uncharacterized membrane protein YkvI
MAGIWGVGIATLIAAVVTLIWSSIGKNVRRGEHPNASND